MDRDTDALYRNNADLLERIPAVRRRGEQVDRVAVAAGGGPAFGASGSIAAEPDAASVFDQQPAPTEGAGGADRAA